MAKMKIDRQIIAIANVNGASLIYTNDNNLAKFAKSRGIEAIALWDLPVPPEDPQMDFLAVVEMDEAPEPEAEDDQDDDARDQARARSDYQDVVSPQPNVSRRSRYRVQAKKRPAGAGLVGCFTARTPPTGHAVNPKIVTVPPI